MDERNFTYMFYGFAAAWLILVLYVITLVARERNLKREVDTLRKLLEGRETK